MKRETMLLLLESINNKTLLFDQNTLAITGPSEKLFQIISIGREMGLSSLTRPHPYLRGVYYPDTILTKTFVKIVEQEFKVAQTDLDTLENLWNAAENRTLIRHANGLSRDIAVLNDQMLEVFIYFVMPLYIMCELYDLNINFLACLPSFLLDGVHATHQELSVFNKRAFLVVDTLVNRWKGYRQFGWTPTVWRNLNYDTH